VRVYLPARIELTCPHCRLAFTLSSSLINNRPQMGCPFCRSDFAVYDALPPHLRRKVYYTLRDEMEHQIYLAHKNVRPDYFDEWGRATGTSQPDPEP
jgi:hypothetical protein